MGEFFMWIKPIRQVKVRVWNCPQHLLGCDITLDWPFGWSAIDSKRGYGLLFSKRSQVVPFHNGVKIYSEICRSVIILVSIVHGTCSQWWRGISNISISWWKCEYSAVEGFANWNSSTFRRQSTFVWCCLLTTTNYQRVPGHAAKSDTIERSALEVNDAGRIAS